MTTAQVTTKGAHKGPRRVVQATDAELVTIGIARDAIGRPDALTVRTGTHAPATIQWVHPTARAAPLLPTEVLWTTLDLIKGERLLIEPKLGQHQFFDWESFELDHQHFTVASGKVTLHQPHAKGAAKRNERHEWHYNVVLESPELHRPLVLDPVIIIVEEP
jgi:hypothetical protein